jgi:hypothetical protein
MVDRMPAVLGTRQRAIDGYRDLIRRYAVEDVTPVDRLVDRERIVDRLTEELRPLLDAIVEADAAAAEVTRLRALERDHDGSTLSSIARMSLVRAEDRRRIASARVRELARDERTLLRYLLLRYLVRR